MNNLTIFRFEQQAIRVVGTPNNPWWVAKDVADALEIRDAYNATRHLDDDEKGTRSVSTPGGEQQMLCVNESGLYSLILTSRKPEAKVFKRWITHEVLPAIRKTGTYSTGYTSDRTPSLEEINDVFSDLTPARLRAIEQSIPHLAQVARLAIANESAYPKRKTLKVKAELESQKLTAEQWAETCSKDSIAAWINSCVVQDPDWREFVGCDRKDTSKLFGSYNKFCTESDRKPVSSTVFSNHLLGLATFSLGWKLKKLRVRDGIVIIGVRIKRQSDTLPFTDLPS